MPIQKKIYFGKIRPIMNITVIVWERLAGSGESNIFRKDASLMVFLVNNLIAQNMIVL